MMISLSGCGFTWPEWATIDKDPWLFTGGDEPENTTPPPPVVIPKDAPDQNAPQSQIVPSSTFGLNLDTYFAQNIEDPATRIQRLENVVVALHTDLQNLRPDLSAPPVPESIAMEPPQQLYTEQAPAMITPEPAPAPIPTPEAPPAENYASPTNGDKVDPGSWLATESSAGQVLATGIRVGEHGDRVRVVFDVTKDTKFSADLDNDEHILVVELPEAAWRAPDQAAFPKITLFESYKIDPFNGGAGSIAVIQLKKSSSILKQQTIPALSGSGKRIYIDLAK